VKRQGFIGDDLYDNAIILKEFALVNGFCESEGVIDAEYKRFVYDMNYPDAKLGDFIQKHSALIFWLQVGSNEYPLLGKNAQVVLKVPTSLHPIPRL
jgi:hypothetical protein